MADLFGSTWWTRLGWHLETVIRVLTRQCQVCGLKFPAHKISCPRRDGRPAMHLYRRHR
jgi:hypothetical protein